MFRKPLKFLAQTFSAAVLAGCLCLHAEDAASRVWPMPALSGADAWSIQGKPEKLFEFNSADGAIAVRFDSAKDNSADLRLKEPLPVPDEATGLSFLCGNNGASSGLFIKPIIKDASGAEFLFHTSSKGSYGKGVFYPEHAWMRCVEERFYVPGLARPTPEPRAGATLEAPRPNLEPKRPFTLLGFRFIGDHLLKGNDFVELYLRDFSFTKLDPQSSKLYYQFRDVESYGELDKLPYFTPAHFGKWYGKRFDLCWELRDSYEGNPFLADGRTFRFEAGGWEKKADKPYPLLLAERIELPVREKGTYWLKVRTHWFHDGKKAVPDAVEEREFRLDVINGDAPQKRKPVATDAQIANCFVRIAPEREALVYSAEEPFIVKTLFRKPEGDLGDMNIKISVDAGAETVKALDLKPEWDKDGLFRAEVDLSGSPAGAYKVKATLRSGEKPLDETECLVGKKEAPQAAGKTNVPKASPSAADLISGPRPMFPLTPMLPEDARTDSKRAWEEYYKPFLDRAGEISTDIELQVIWKDVEPLPGVFDWRAVDRFADYAKTKGLKLFLWPEFRSSSTPDWLPSLYEKNENGKVFGSGASYLYHGGRLNYIHAGIVRSRVANFVKNLAEHFNSRPELQGYFICYEHPGDSPFLGWYEGYSEESQAAFKKHMMNKFKDIEPLNARWGTSFTSWDALTAPPAKDAPPAYALDWLRFKTESIEVFMKEMVSIMRSVDDKRLILVYADGISDYAWFREHGCMSANGGSHDVKDMPDYASYAMAGMPQRTEDHSPGNWTAYFPAQLDASVFAMTAAGGANTSCRAYVFTKNKFSDANDPNVSLGRYKRFIPVWTELRGTVPAEPIDVFILKDLSSYLLRARTTYTGWFNSVWTFACLMQAQTPCATTIGTDWEKGKLLIADSSMAQLERKTIDRMANYVENGGTLLMSADAGRKCLEQPDADWVLLSRFGFQAPEGEPRQNFKAKAIPVDESLFGASDAAFTLRDTWNVKPPANAETIARFDGDPNKAALSWKAYGKGKVAVCWAQTIVPPLFSDSDGQRPFLRDIARWAGVKLPGEASDNRLWINLLKTKDSSKFYGLVHEGVWQNTPSVPVEGAVRWTLPAGEKYKVVEILSGKELGEFTSEQLLDKGLPVKLGPHEVAIFRMTRSSSLVFRAVGNIFGGE